MNLFKLFASISLDKSDYDKGVKEATDQGESLASKLGGGLAKAGQVAAKGLTLIGGAATAAVGGLLALESSTEEYRIAQGKLNTAFEAAGYSAETAQQAYNAFYGILGDTDTATEASQLLAKLADSEEDVATWTNIAAGVSGTFGDSLPIEGLIEASNETAKVGQVTGVLADALNWAGISEDEFNARLEDCTSESERNQLIMDTLAGTYNDAASAFYRNNDALVANRNNQAALDESLAQIGESISTVKNNILSGLIPAFQNFVDSVDWDSVETAVTNFVNAIIKNGPMIISIVASIGAGFAAWKITSVVQSVIGALTSLIPALTGATGAQKGLNTAMNANPIGIIITLIATLVTGIITLWNTNEDFRNAVIEIWENIKSFFSIVGFFTETIPNAIQTMIQWFKDLPGNIWDALVEAVTNIANWIIDLQNKATELRNKVIEKVIGFFRDLPENIWNALVKVVTKVSDWILDMVSKAEEIRRDVVEKIVGFFKELPREMLDIGKDIVQGIWDGISSMVTWIKEKISGFVGGIVDGVKGILGIKSPSKVFAGIGEYMAEGLGKGWNNEYDKIKKQIENGLVFGTGSVDFSSSGLGIASAGMVNGISSAIQSTVGDGSYTFNLLFPDYTKLASYTFQPMVDYAKANGTPILTPT